MSHRKNLVHHEVCVLGEGGRRGEYVEGSRGVVTGHTERRK